MRSKQKLVRDTAKSLKKAAPTILTCIGSIGVIATAVLAAKAAPKADWIIRRRQMELWVGDSEEVPEIPLSEKVQLTWTCYIPAAITGIATIGCIFGANTLNRKQQASLISAYAFLDRSFREYQNGVKEVLGEDAHKQVMEHLMVEKATPPTIVGALTGEPFDFGVTDEEKLLFYDAFSQRYFEAKVSDVLLAELHTNRNFAINGGEVPLSTFYDFLGLDTPEELKNLYWFVSDYYYFIDFTHTRHYIEDGFGHEPVECWEINMPYPPTLEPLEY